MIPPVHPMQRRNPRICASLIASAVSVAIVAIWPGAGAQASPFPAVNGSIVFVSDRDSVDSNGNGALDAAERNRDIYSIGPGGRGLTRLTTTGAAETHPAVSPDGRWIAFTTDRDGSNGIYLMRADGSRESRVTDRGAPEREPSFSADGQRLAYTVSHASTLPGAAAEGDIWTTNVDGTEATRLTFDRDIDQFAPSFSPDGSKIAFVGATPGGPDSSRDVFVMNADGSDLVNLTAGNGGSGFEDTDPSFSPDGTSIAFTSTRSGGTEIWVMGINGTGPAQLTDTLGRDEHPVYSPDGTSIAFTARRGGSTDVYTMSAADGSGQTRLTDDAPLDEREELAAWQPLPPPGQLEAFIDSGPARMGSDDDVAFTYSPAPGAGGGAQFECELDGGGFSPCPADGRAYSELPGGPHVFKVRATGAGAPDPEPAAYEFVVDTTQIVFSRGEGGDSEIVVASADGSRPHRLTDNAHPDQEPALSPDGERVAFVSERDGDNEIYVVGVDGTGLRQLTSNAAADRSPTFSPGGDQIAFTSRRDGNLELYVMRASDGGAQTNVTNSPAADREPSYSPDGTALTFASDRDSPDADIYSVPLAGGDATRLTDDPAPERAPDYSPDGRVIAFTRDMAPERGLPTNDEIWIMSAGGSRERNITNHPRGIDDRDPNFRPQGGKLAFESQGDIFSVASDGKRLTRLTATADRDSAPDWGPADRVAPETRIDSGPAGTVTERKPRLTFSSPDDSATFECRIDEQGPWVTCSSPFIAPSLQDGPHEISVRAVDRAGNADASPATRAFVVDATAPETEITLGPNRSIPAGSTRFEFSANEADASFECRLDEGPWAACKSPAQYEVTELGEHLFEVRSRDLAGNVDSTPSTWAFAVTTSQYGEAPPTPKLELQAKKKQKPNKLKLKASCGELPCEAKISGKAKLRRKGKKAKSYKLKTKTVWISEGETRTVKLKFKKQKKSTKKIKKLLDKDKKARKRNQLTVEVSAAGAGAWTDEGEARIKLKG